MAAKLSAMPFLTDKNNPVGYCVQGAIEFGMDSRRLIQRVQEDCGCLRNWILHHGIHRLHCEAGFHPDQQHHCGRQLKLLEMCALPQPG
eukprot:s1344_g8.t1